MPPRSRPTLPTVRARPRVSFWRSRNGRATAGLLAPSDAGPAVRAARSARGGGTLPEELFPGECNFYLPAGPDRVGLTPPPGRGFSPPDDPYSDAMPPS